MFSIKQRTISFPACRPGSRAIIATHIAACVFAFLLKAAATATAQTLPDRHTSTDPINHETMMSYLENAQTTSHIEVTNEGESVEGRAIPLVTLRHPGAEIRWRVFFFGLQHGNEHAGKDALLHLIQKIENDPDRLPPDVELSIIPMLNPDGGERNRRTNANGNDLNRDHQWLHEPETQLLHRVVRQLRPHISVDAHEYSRDSGRYGEHGWMRWAIIMMDTQNNPLLHDSLHEAGLRWIDGIKPVMRRHGHNYKRYYVAGPPPDSEQRYSTMEMNDARNGLGAYGGLSFITESGVRRGLDHPQEDLPDRVDAYLVLLENFLLQRDWIEEDRVLIEQAREAPLPDFIPVNYFWGSAGLKESKAPVIELETGNEKMIPTANFMKQRVVKSTVPTPQGYLIPPHAAEEFSALLGRHGLDYTTLEEEAVYTVEKAELLRIEPDFDGMYNRFANRQITRRGEPEEWTAPAGSLLVELSPPEGRRTALLLEPTMLYGIYSHERYRGLVDKEGTMPVLRIVETP